MLRPALQYRPEDRGFLLCMPEAEPGAVWQRVLRGLPGNLQGRERLTPATARIFPWPWVKIVMMRSASPSLIVRSTTPSSRYRPLIITRV